MLQMQSRLAPPVPRDPRSPAPPPALRPACPPTPHPQHTHTLALLLDRCPPQVPDSEIDPVQELPRLEDLKPEGADLTVGGRLWEAVGAPRWPLLLLGLLRVGPRLLPATAGGSPGFPGCGQRHPAAGASTRHPPPPVAPAGAQALLRQTAVLKLNGGLGTSMGLEKAKSLLEVGVRERGLCGRWPRALGGSRGGGMGTLPVCRRLPALPAIRPPRPAPHQVKDGKTFLDLIAEQIKHTREKYGEQGRAGQAAGQAAGQRLPPGCRCRLAAGDGGVASPAAPERAARLASPPQAPRCGLCS